MEELHKDLAELEALESQVTRQKIKNILAIEISKLKVEISNVPKENGQPDVSVPSQSNSVVTQKKLYEVKVSNYAWDQTSKFIKFYVTLPKVHTLPAENVTCNFTNKSLKMLAHDLEQKNHVFVINNLLYNIKPEESTWKVKTDMVIINAAKANDKKWEFVTELEKRSHESSKPKFDTDNDKDPSESLMKMLKNMYDTGDDEMKRTLQKAWHESQNKKFSADMKE